MSVNVFKYPLPQEDNRVQMPLLAKVLCLHSQNECPTIWAQVDPSLPTEERRFLLIPTGAEIPNDARRGYVGTVLLMSGGLVLHVYEISR